MPSVIERFGTTINRYSGAVNHDDRPSSYEHAEKLAGRKLDRRRNYAIIEGVVCELAEWSQACSGCYEGYDSMSARGHGCEECGYTGRRHHGSWVPLPGKSNATQQGANK